MSSNATTLGHEAHSMPPIDAAQRRRDCMCESRLHKGEEIAAQLVGNKHIALVTKFLVSRHLCKINSA